MRLPRLTRFTAPLIGAFLLAACGGGIEGTGVVSSGAVTAKTSGSIDVNGVSYNTTGSSITVDGVLASTADLKTGQSVIVTGTSSSATSGTANLVAVDTMVKGPVDVVYNSGTQVLGVLGQDVQVTNQTVIDSSVAGGAGVGALIVNDLVKVYGHVRADGVIEATLIEDGTGLTGYKVIGTARTIVATSFTIGGLTIDISGADLTNLAGGKPTDGQLVEAKGSTTLGAGGELVASKVEPAGVAGTTTAHVELEGFVTVMTTPSPTTPAFEIGDVSVVTTGSTLFEGGLPGDIDVGSKLEVEGSLSAGTLTATKVSFRYNVRLEGDVATYTGGNTITIDGLGGITVTLDALTDQRNPVTVGNHFRLRGYKTGPGTVVATRFEDRGAADPQVILQGPVEAEVPGTSVTILGITADTGSVSTFRDVSDTAITSTRFYDLVDINSLVKASGTLSGSITWTQMELED